MWTSAELKLRAKGAFYKNYWYCVLTALVMTIFTGIGVDKVTKFIQERDYYMYTDTFFGRIGDFFFSPLYSVFGIRIALGLFGILLLFVKVFLGNVLTVGGCRFFIMNQTTNPTASEFGFGFQPRAYSKVVLAMFLKHLFEALWTLLFIIPGVIKHYEYLMIPYILAENPEMDYHEAFLISKRMMNGQKLNAFVLELSFIGWGIVSLLTFGIAGVFFVDPYYQATLAELYSVNRTVAYQEGYIR